ncbi:G-type lectin S-receptor-like serine/threonine-protein kinase At2g19130 [Curcuma longa]|uniref:G-type lectin S-receptor-like serine/threonine-protein kinase At2g19130 n=1 Tax=Curcuma longa TaxID=136217 RepID=UPI003D9F7300
MALAMALSCSIATSFLLLSFTLSSLSLLSFTSAATSTDTISAQHSLTGNQTITSGDGTFVLGFFTPPGSGGNYYIGIWYGKNSVLTPVWVANRVTPVTDPTTSELKISDDGNLVLLDQFKSIIWSTNVTAISSSNSTVVAVILDDGNLQLRDGSNSSLIFWQSFDHPTDTWLPGAKLGFNKITKNSQHLTSWKNKVDPSPGIFTFGMDPAGSLQYLISWNSSRIYWASGMWDGNKFSLVPEATSNFMYHMHVVNDTDEMYIRYTVDVDNQSTYRQVLNYDTGQIQVLVWMQNSKSWTLVWARPTSKCAVYGACGPFGSCNDLISPFCYCVKGFRIKSQTDWDLGDQSQGCERVAPLQCSGQNNSEEDGFFKMENVGLPDNSLSLAMFGSSQDCEQACLSNCSCNAYSINSTGCFVWHGELLNLQQELNQPGAGTLYLRLAASEFQTSESNKKRMVAPITVGVVVPAVVVCLFIIGGLVWKRKRRRAIQNSKVMHNSLVSFMYDELRIATKNFSEKLGAGGFGSVFKGSLPGSIDIAVKKLEGLYQGEKQFRAEVSTLGAIQHVNLIRLIGFCSQGTKKLLIYELMPNGSLADQLFRSNSNVLDWKTRYQIAIGTARGLTYLHEQCRENIIHCDIKPENILLDDALVPKVADFGLAKLMGRNFSKVLTTIRGSRGYLAPEWIEGTPITTKVDVYSYGMMLFEIISGQRNLVSATESCFEFFPTVATSKLINGDVAGLLDHRLEGEADLGQLEVACKLAGWCIQDDESSRPTMSQIVQVLEGNLDISIPPIPKFLKDLTNSWTDNLISCGNFSSYQNSNSCASSTSHQINNATT